MTDTGTKMEKNCTDINNYSIIELEEEIDKEIKKLPRIKSNLPYIVQRQLALKQMNKNSDIVIIECLDLQNNQIKLFNIAEIRNAREKYLNEEIAKIDDPKLTRNKKLLKVLNNINSSETYEYDVKEEEKELNIIQPILTDTDSTMDTTQSKYYYDYKDEKVNFWIKNRYSDYFIESNDKSEKIPIQKLCFKDINNKEYLAYLYEDNLKTYNFAISKFFPGYKPSKKEVEDEKFRKECRLYFCGKTIRDYKKICKQDEMMCNECMEKNLRLYELNSQKHYLININGRVCSDNFKGGERKYHCIGKFVVNKEIKNCLPGEFSCKACNMLNGIKSYYNKK